MAISLNKLTAYQTRMIEFFSGERGNQRLIFLLLSAVFLISIFFNPADEPRFSVCIFKNVTGLDCPGCGLTRSFCALSKGNLSKAFYFNKLGPFLYVTFLLLWLRALLTLFRFDRFALAISKMINRYPLSKIGLATFAIYWVARTALHFAGYHF